MKRILLLMLILIPGVTLMAQGVKGTILKKGKPKKGVVIWLKKADLTATTDKEGAFAFDRVATDDTLQIAATGKLDAKVPVNAGMEVSISLDNDDFAYNDGTGDKRLAYTKVPAPKGGNSGVNHELIMRSGFRTVSEVLKNCVAGIIVQEDMTGSSIRIRGINSINASNEPLVVIDGVALQGVSDLDAMLPVETVESIVVLKDGGGYGVRGANGVIEITTIKGGNIDN